MKKRIYEFLREYGLRWKSEFGSLFISAHMPVFWFADRWIEARGGGEDWVSYKTYRDYERAQFLKELKNA